MISIIIPAHNEETVIATALKELIAGTVSGELELIIVCNGCTDKTAEVVASFGNTVKCIETPIPSKANALNLGDSKASGFPRIYQDADVVLSLDAIRQIAQVLGPGKVLAAAPVMRMDFRNASWLVRSYYEVWQKLPYVQEGMIGTGVYALSEKGRKRFDRFPEIIADDGYVRALFKSDERATVDLCYSLVQAPADLASLLKIKTRSRLGRYELRNKFPNLLENEEKKYINAMFGLLTRLYLWPKLPVYLYVNLITRFKANKYARAQGYTGWERDESSRGGIKENMKKKIMLVSSSGGHWVQLNRLLPAFDGCEKIFVTTESTYRETVGDNKFLVVPDATRWNKLRVLYLALVMLKHILFIKPDVVVSTGAAPGFFALFWGKKIGAKTIWLDSIANVDELSLSGKKVQSYADLWLTQWEHLATPDGPRYEGAVL